MRQRTDARDTASVRGIPECSPPVIVATFRQRARSQQLAHQFEFGGQPLVRRVERKRARVGPGGLVVTAPPLRQTSEEEPGEVALAIVAGSIF